MGGGMGLFALGMLAAQAIRIVRNRAAVARTLPVHDVHAHLPNSIRVEPHLLASNLADHEDGPNSPTEATIFLSPRRGSSPLGPPLQSAPTQTVTSSNTLYAADARPIKFGPDTDQELPPDELARSIAASLASSFPIDAVVQPKGRMTAEQRALAALDGVFESSDEDGVMGDDRTEIDVDGAMYDRDADIGRSWSTASSSVNQSRSPMRGNSSTRTRRSGSSLHAAASTAIEAGGARNVLVVPALGAPNGAMPRSPTPPPVVTSAPPLVITSTADASHGPVQDGASRPLSAVMGASTPRYEPGRRLSSQFLAVPSSSMSLSFPSSKSTTRSASKASSIDEAATPSSDQLHRSHSIARGTRRGSTSTPTTPDTRTPSTPSTRQSSSRHFLGTPATSRTTLDGPPAAAAVDVTAVAHAIAMESLRIDQATTRQQHRQRMLARRNSSTSTWSARAVVRQRLTSQRVAQSTSQLDRTARPSVPLGRGEPVAWSVDACNARIGRDGRPARQGAVAGAPRAELDREVDVRPLQAKRRESREEKLARRSQWVMELMTYESVGV
ncbi:hypothetical protein GGF31_003101 [Allomyces arbusculus]|nr:hypothetical protein GGF31_003101 [Allomyces arbusculus]